METIDVELPNGVVLPGVPANSSRADVIRIAIERGVATESDFDPSIPPPSGSFEMSRMGQPQQPPEEKNILQRAAEFIESPTGQSTLWGAGIAAPVAAFGRGLTGLAGLYRAGRGAIASPSVLAGIGRSMVPQTGRGLAGEVAVGGLGGAASYEVGQRVPEGSLGGAARPMAEMVAGAAVTLPAIALKNATTLWFSRGVGQEVKQAGIDIADDTGVFRAGRMIETAQQANPNLVPSILRASEIEKRTGISLPVLAASAGDTTISAYVLREAANVEDPVFAANLAAQYKAAEDALRFAKKGQAPTMEEVDALVKKRYEEVQAKNNKVVNIARSLSEGRRATIERLNFDIRSASDLSSQVAGKGDVGARLSNLIEAKRATLIEEFKPLYDDVVKNNEAIGISVPKDVVRGLTTFIRGEAQEEVFKKFPSLYSSVQRFYGRKSPAINKDGSATLSSIHSLSKEVNKALRQTRDADQRRMLSALKGEVDRAIDNTDAAFSVPYREINMEYASRVGLPFSEQGVIDINRAKFVENGVDSLTKNASSLNDAMAVVGDSPEGIEIVTDAFLFDVSRNKSIVRTVGDGSFEINPTALSRYIADNKEKIDLVPGLRERLEGLKTNVSDMTNRRAFLLEQEKAAQIKQTEDYLAKAYNKTGGLTSIVAKALNNQAEADVLIETVRKDPTALNAIKGALVDALTSLPGSRSEILEANTNLLSSVFGKEGLENLRALTEASERLRDFPLELKVDVVQAEKSAVERITGISGSRIAGTVRQANIGILSKTRALINLGSVAFQKRISNTQRNELRKFLLDKEAIADAAKLMKDLELNKGGIGQKGLNLLGKLVSNYKYAIYGGAAGTIAAESVEDKPAATFDPNDPLLQGWVGAVAP